MKKTRIFNLLCCLFCFYGCSECDNAELVGGDGKDTHTAYSLIVPAYERDRNFIKECCKMGGKTIDFDKQGSILPSEQEVEEYKKDIKGFFYVNNNIVLSQLFYRMAVMKAKFELLIEKLAENNVAKLKADLVAAFDNAKNEIDSILGELKTPGQEGFENQAIYGKMGKIDKVIQESVHGKLIPEIIEQINAKKPDLAKKFQDDDLKNNLTIGVESILVGELYDHDELATELNKRLPKFAKKD